MRSTTGHSPTLLQCRWRRLLATGPLVGVLALTASGLAQADVITSVNGALLNIVRSTSASLIDGPPEVAREIAMIDGSMFNAVSAASSNSYAAVAFAGGTISGASADAAALQAAITVMDSLYESPSSLYQQYKGVTGAQVLWPHVAVPEHPRRSQREADERCRHADRRSRDRAGQPWQ